ncbi:prepilin-type N-terminal cleavage/methylation domain-containing protein [Neorhodopirellula lusitana]|uniref:Prepilin-type N-terminal cleavage/methylation domain-containing protein n=1 Tax=Neorhodopirellula lusitana TaxID=445327 RepID=A0ABY1QPQ3_9BACT|nr:prepilin-type N-terminal cleavage/methylation domain-containing protein [Neorhodopirellula lusitana]SMP76795.1 prepilin-type N-terminal cleavage/methylation domain-containing protein [Neorhodopirellula lusitana]
MVPRKHSDSGFTLVELLVVMVVIGIMSSMVAIAVQGVTASARASRTRTIIGMIDSVIQEKYDSYKYRSLPVEIPTVDYVAGVTGSTLSFEVLGSEAARVRLNMIRDLQRMEMPDRFSDFQQPPASIYGAADRVLIDSGDIDGDGDTEELILTRKYKAQRTSFKMSWYENTTTPYQFPSTAQAYSSRMTGAATTEYQSAECLYLILATSYSSGTPAIDAIPTSNIGDLDGDGMFEIWDAWGQPIGFIRWPVGYSDPDGIIDYTTADEFDLFRSDFYYTVQTPPAPSSTSVLPAVNVNTGSAIAPWALRPLVISAGEDGDFGIAFNPIDDGGNPLDTFAYSSASWIWPKDTANMGAESQGRGAANYQWCDPYLRRFLHDNDVSVLDRTSATYATDTSRRLPGEELTGGPNQALADNITNFSLQVAQ